MPSVIQQTRLEVEQLRREAAMKRIPVSQAVEDIKVRPRSAVGGAGDEPLMSSGAKEGVKWYWLRQLSYKQGQFHLLKHLSLPFDRLGGREALSWGMNN
jgi:hypothetical protein